MPVSCQCSNWLQNLLPNDWDEAGARFACSDESEIGAGFLKSIYAASFWHMYQGPIDSVRSETMLIVISVLFIIFENFMCSWETCCLCYFCHSVAHSCDCSGFMSRKEESWRHSCFDDAYLHCDSVTSFVRPASFGTNTNLLIFFQKKILYRIQCPRLA